MPQSLDTYRAKRDFKKTKEPSGSTRVRAASYPRFVIQKHEATRLHYDLRLEVDGVFKSWAVTRGPSLDPADKRLAVEVEDHPLDYGDFEGTIPKGEYGGGTVMLWDRGFWAPLDDKPASQALRDGELKFNIAGSKLKGSWVLVRMKHDRTRGSRTNWLLIKHKDEWAKPGDNDQVLKEDRSAASGRTMKQIAAGEGDGPAPFVTATRKMAKPDAVWHANASAAKAAPKRSVKSKPAASSKPPRIVGVKAAGNKVLGVTISKPDKVLWPAVSGSAAVTKAQFAEYLATVGPWMIEHIRERPCSLLRAPDGINGETFFQRHAMAGMSDLVGTIATKGDHKPYLRIDTVEGLVAMGQIAALEFHPWNCAPLEPTVPDRLIFDLDPAPDVPFTAVVDAAKAMRERLEALGLIAFCKTTGGKGLHVVTPLRDSGADGIGWDEAKTFAQAVSAQMAEDSPDLYLTNMAKKQRTGRIFLDYLRNDSTATAVAPLSPRARPGATVSMPLTWSQVRRDLDPSRYTIHTVSKLMAKTKAWHEYFGSRQRLKSAIEALVGTSR